MTALPALTATQALALLRAGDLSVVDLAAACLARIAERDAAVRAWAFLDPEAVMAQARALDARPDKGPLHGVPIGVKDVILTADWPTQQGSPLYAGCRPGLDAACVATLRAAGALILGKTDTTEFAATTRGNRARHPADPARTPGGSSSGSAAAVADGQALLALGTQTAGSVIRPASFCGVAAIKPTWSAISREGLKMLSPSLDTLGLFARSVDDLALLADVFGLEDREPSVPFALRGARIGACRTPLWERADAATRDAFARGIALIEAEGATVVPIDLPPRFADLAAHQAVIMAGEAQASLLNEARTRPDLLHDDLKAQAENRSGITRARLLEAYDAAAVCRADFDQLALGFGAILTPSAPGEAPVGTATGDPCFNAMWTLLHVPVINLPGFAGPAGLPIGLSLVAPRYRDRQLLAVAAAIGPLFEARGAFGDRAGPARPRR